MVWPFVYFWGLLHRIFPCILPFVSIAGTQKYTSGANCACSQRMKGQIYFFEIFYFIPCCSLPAYSRCIPNHSSIVLFRFPPRSVFVVVAFVVTRTTPGRGSRPLPGCSAFPTNSTVRVCRRSTRPSFLGSKRLDRIECRTCAGGCQCGSGPDWVCGCSKCPRHRRRSERR